MTLREACKSSLTILKQVMEEKLNATNVEVGLYIVYTIKEITSFFFMLVALKENCLAEHNVPVRA